jgi:hypothetical protein
MAASEVLWSLSGHRYGACDVLVRPCRRSCGPTESLSRWWWDMNTWPSTASGWPGWLDVACGRCGSSCSCSAVSEVHLPALAQAVIEVVIDGEVLPPSGYGFYDGYRLVKVEGEWPLCQDWSVPVSGVGAWHVVARYGQPVPILGQRAVAELAHQIDLVCQGESCELSNAMVESITRAGVTKRFNTDWVNEGRLVGLPISDQFIRTVNPNGIRVGPKIWDPDDFGSPRRPGGVP